MSAPAPTRPLRRRPGTWVTVASLLIAGLGGAPPVVAQAPDESEDRAGDTPLAVFGALVVGEWEAADSRHEFVWGVGQQVLKSTSFAPDGDAWVVVSEGWWYWDPAGETIRGQTVAVGMGIDLFEYTSRVDDREVVHELVSHGEYGGTYVERWLFDDEGYTWALEQDGAHVMGGSYRKVR